MLIHTVKMIYSLGNKTKREDNTALAVFRSILVKALKAKILVKTSFKDSKGVLKGNIS
jgi:hypothetical protein